MSESLSRIQLTALQYQLIRDRLRALDRDLDDQTLGDTLEGLTDLHEVLAAVVREALNDEALALGLRHRIGAMAERLERLLFRAAKRREIAREVMAETEVKKVTAPDLTLILRPGSPALVVTDERAIPAEFWVAREPRLNRQELLTQLKAGTEIQGAQLSNPQPVLTVRTK
jgi:Siphovirus Gp157